MVATGCVGGGGSKRRGWRGGTPRKPTMNTSVYTRIVTSWIVNWNLRKLAAVRESRNILDTQYPFSLCSVWMPSARPVPFLLCATQPPSHHLPLHRCPYNRLPYFEPLPLENVYWFYFIFILFIYTTRGV